VTEAQESKAEVWECKAKAWESSESALKCSALVQEAAEKPKITKLLAQWSTGHISANQVLCRQLATVPCNHMFQLVHSGSSVT
jgi:hypothetical protein